LPWAGRQRGYFTVYMCCIPEPRVTSAVVLHHTPPECGYVQIKCMCTYTKGRFCRVKFCGRAGVVCPDIPERALRLRAQAEQGEEMTSLPPAPCTRAGPRPTTFLPPRERESTSSSSSQPSAPGRAGPHAARRPPPSISRCNLQARTDFYSRAQHRHSYWPMHARPAGV